MDSPTCPTNIFVQPIPSVPCKTNGTVLIYGSLPVPVADLGFVKGGFTNVNVRKSPYQV